jgi:flavodoxin
MKNDTMGTMKKALVVYYTFSGTTGRLAAEIARQTGADLREIRPETPYAFDHHTAAKEARSEIERGFCPRLAAGLGPVGQYDCIFIGSPNWFHNFAPPIRSFLRNTDLAGKIVVPFCTSGGGGLSQMPEEFARECPRSRILPGFAASPDFTPEQVSQWLQRAGLQR